MNVKNNLGLSSLGMRKNFEKNIGTPYSLKNIIIWTREKIRVIFNKKQIGKIEYRKKRHFMYFSAKIRSFLRGSYSHII